mmetsp:Transcript_10/g.40  ORF Transcript_10/g.40 Transcript_10/m.40 type:complete len:325 (+) Transcript_10:328-1302(+)
MALPRRRRDAAFAFAFALGATLVSLLAPLLALAPIVHHGRARFHGPARSARPSAGRRRVRVWPRAPVLRVRAPRASPFLLRAATLRVQSGVQQRVLPLLHLANLAEVRVPQRLTRAQAVVRVVLQKLLDQVDALLGRVRDELVDAAAGGFLKVEVHVLRHVLHLLEQLRRRRADDAVNLLDLIELVRPGEQREQRHDLEEHAPDAPHVHLVVVVPVREQTLRGSVPPRGDVLRVRLLAVNPPARPKVREFQLVVHDQDVLGLDVAVEDPVPMHVIHALDQLIHICLHPVLIDVVPPSADELVDVHVHELEHEREPARGLVVQNL